MSCNRAAAVIGCTPRMTYPTRDELGDRRMTTLPAGRMSLGAPSLRARRFGDDRTAGADDALPFDPRPRFAAVPRRRLGRRLPLHAYRRASGRTRVGGRGPDRYCRV